MIYPVEFTRELSGICKDRYLAWLSKYHYVPVIILGAILLAFGGLRFFLWGMFFRVTMSWHKNPHAHATSARHGLAWYEIDMSWSGIHYTVQGG